MPKPTYRMVILAVVLLLIIAIVVLSLSQPSQARLNEVNAMNKMVVAIDSRTIIFIGLINILAIICRAVWRDP